MSFSYIKNQYCIVDDGAKIGSNTKIGSFSQICRDASIGRNCDIRNGVYVAAYARIGNNVTVGNNVSVFSGVYLHDNVYCASNVVFSNTVNPRAKAFDESKIFVKHGAVLGANCTVLNNVVIGEFAFIGAGAVVKENVLPHAVMVGVPARRIGWMCVCGNRLKFSLNLEISESHTAQCSCKLKYMIKNDKCIMVQEFL